MAYSYVINKIGFHNQWNCPTLTVGRPEGKNQQDRTHLQSVDVKGHLCTLPLTTVVKAPNEANKGEQEANVTADACKVAKMGTVALEKLL